MTLAFTEHIEYFAERVRNLLRAAGIDYFIRWDQAIGKGRGTEPHPGRGTYASTNSVMMVAFLGEAALEALTQLVTAESAGIRTDWPRNDIRSPDRS